MEADDLLGVLDRSRLKPAESKLVDRFLSNGAFGHAYVGLRDGVVIGCAGLSVIWIGRAEGWAVISTAVDQWDMRWITRQARQKIAELGARLKLGRLEATVLADWKQGNHWARILGFSPEGVLRQYDLEGRDHRLYARIFGSWSFSQPPQPPQVGLVP